jgi:hypothetical protein
VAIFAAVVVAGLAGSQTFTGNLAPTFVYVVFWVGVPVASVLLGDVFRAVSPWRALARTARWLLGRSGHRPRPLLGSYPPSWGRWPAAAGLVAFAWLELVYPSKDDPRLLGVLALAYAGVQLAGMACWGIEAWTTRADAFGVYFGLLARLAPLAWRDGRVWLRAPLAGVCALERWPGTVALVCAAIGTTTFDGFSNGSAWAELARPLQRAATGLGLGDQAAYELAATVGLVGCVLAVAALYQVGVRGVVHATGRDRAAVSSLFAHSLVPVAFGYLLAHYFSLLVLQGQAMGYLVSNPLGRDSDLFGTAGFLVDYSLIPMAAIWYVQVAALVGGHVGGLILAHDRGLVAFRDPRLATRAQYSMLAVMVAFTSLALWLLSAVTTTG